jgi:CelD/BcsL family acetyltransferase involved in cellulose biosynthesis
MTVVALRPLPIETRIPAAFDGHLARVALFDDLSAAEPHWRALECAAVLATPYQRFDFLSLWQQHVGAPAGVRPCIVVGFNALGTPLLLLPLGLRSVGGLRVAEFLGGKHANFNLGLWRRDVAAHIGIGEIDALLAQIAVRADVVTLINQPLTWAGATNPFALMPHQRSANFGFSGALVQDFDALLRTRTNSAARKKMRKKEQALASYGTVRFDRVSGESQVRHVLDAFFKQKAMRMRLLGVSDAFGEPGVRRFIEAASTEGVGGEPPVELYALSVDDIVVATMGGTVGGGRFCAMFNSIAHGAFAAESPGEQLIVQLVRQCCERGLDTFDLGVGNARYKNLFCGDAEPLFDSYLPLTARGRLLAPVFAFAGTVKRAIKQIPALWSIVRALRRLRAWLSPTLAL